MANTQFNADKLYNKFGTARAAKAKLANQAGETHFDGEQHQVVMIIDLTTLGSSAAIIEDNYVFPANARITRVDVVAHTAATSGGSATLDIGLMQQTDRSTEVDFNGLIAAMPKTSYDAAGETTQSTAGSTYAGALVGTTNSTASYLTANYNTAAFTAGVVKVTIYYYAA